MQIKTPDIGVEQATVAEILVKVGDTIAFEDSIVLLESDKASVEVPSTAAGVVKSILISVGDEIAEGAVLIELESATSASADTHAQAKTESPSAASVQPPVVESQVEQKPAVVDSTHHQSSTVDVTVPDIGVEKALIAEILVQVGDEIALDESIVLLESDKASVEVPSTVAGRVKSIAIQLGDSVKEGVVLISVETTSAQSETLTRTDVAQAQTQNQTQPKAQAHAKAEPEQVAASAATSIEVQVPDLGVEQATVSEILVQVGDRVEAEQSLCVVESDKASVEVPSSVAGEITAIHVKIGQSVQQGSVLVTIQGQSQQAPTNAGSKVADQAQSSSTSAKSTVVSSAASLNQTQSQTQAQNPVPSKAQDAQQLTQQQESDNSKVYAGPAVRKLARELGVILANVKASGPHQRVLKDDVFAYVKSRLTAAPAPTVVSSAAVSGLPALPDFSAFGGGELKAMTRLQQVSVPQLSLNNFIPQVTQFDLADITALEAWRNELKASFKKQGVSLTILAFIAKALAHLLKEEPYFAGHLADDQKSVLLRNEIHMGIAVATPDGLTVPVLRHPDQKSIKQIAVELAELSQKARDKKLSPKDLQGANFTITSLGSIGGTAFTPLVNWPQVAILGISPATMQPVWNGEGFDPRLMLPLSLSYDHRVINGADAARFTRKLSLLLADIRNILL